MIQSVFSSVTKAGGDEITQERATGFNAQGFYPKPMDEVSDRILHLTFKKLLLSSPGEAWETSHNLQKDWKTLLPFPENLSETTYHNTLSRGLPGRVSGLASIKADGKDFTKK